MTATSTMHPWTNATDAEFRVWSKGISDALIACGLLRTADTGQINFATVLRPTAGSTMAGFEIVRFDDALHATAPVFIKIEYGVGGTTGIPAIFVTLATGTDGAGGLTGKLTERQGVYYSSANPTAGNKQSFYSVNGSGLTMVMGTELTLTAGTLMGVVAIERTLNSDGTPNSSGCWMATFSSGFGVKYHLLPVASTASVPVGAVPTPIVYPHGNGSNNFTSAAEGADVSMFPMNPATPRLHSSARQLMGAYQTDISRFSTFTVSVYGVVSTYIAMGIAVSSAGVSIGSGSPAQMGAASWVLRYE